MWRFRGSKIVYVFPSLGLGSRGFRLVARAVNITDNYILLYIMYVYKRSQSHFFFLVFGNEYVAKCWLHDTNLIFLEYCMQIPRMLLKLYS